MKHIEQDNVQDNVQTCSSMFKAPGPTSASYSSLRSRLQMLKADPGEAAAMIQVIMDIVGMMVTCCLGALILDAF